MPDIISFNDAINDSESCSKRHLFLGNGFSIGCRADIFHYESLFENADFSNTPEVKQVFNAFQTQDFEIVIRALENAAKVLPIYLPDHQKSIQTLDEHATDLKELLVATIAGNHPANPSEIEDKEFLACQQFLSYFIGTDNDKAGHVFTLNYDLLLYWTLMHNDNLSDENAIKLKKNDGFGNDEDDQHADYVVWQGETAAHSANVYFLHGALHLFDAGAELQKYTWIRSGVSLIEQIRTAIEENKFPLFVAEGTSTQKKNKIRHNAYLYQCLKVLTANAQIKSHCFFILGHSLSDGDNHILTRLGKGKFKKLYVGIFGDKTTEENNKVITRAKEMAALRHEKQPLEVVFFDSASANVWEPNQ